MLTTHGNYAQVKSHLCTGVPQNRELAFKQFVSTIHQISREANREAHLSCAFKIDSESIPTAISDLWQFSDTISCSDRAKICQFINKRRRETMSELRQSISHYVNTKSILINLLTLNLMSVIMRQKRSPGAKQHWLPVTYLKKWRQSPKTRKFTVPYAVNDNGSSHYGSVSVDDFVHPAPIYSETVESLFSQFEALYGLAPYSSTENLILAWVQSVRLPLNHSFRGGDTVSVISDFLDVLEQFPQVYAYAASISSSPLTSSVPKIHVNARGALTVSYVMSPEQLLVISTVPPTVNDMNSAVNRHYETVMQDFYQGVTLYGSLKIL